jgi:LemA protein
LPLQLAAVKRHWLKTESGGFMDDKWPLVIMLSIFATVILVSMYNNFIKYRNTIEEQWSGIEVALKRRFNLLPNVVKVVSGYSDYEAGTISAVTEQRLENTPRDHRAEEESKISRSFNELMAVAEAYPELRASNNYLNLQNALNQVELEILQARRGYNAAVRRWNTHVQSFPSNIMAKIFNFKEADYFELELATQREIPEINI